MIEEYSLDLNVDFDSAHILGKVTIRTKDLEQDTLELDAEDMEIKSVKTNERALTYSHDKKSASLKILGLHMSGGEDLKVDIEYEKQIPDNASTGIFKCRNGSDYFIITDFEPDRARLFFPCKDHPLWKATFNVSVTTRSDLKVISNTTLKMIERVDDQQSRFVFNPTPKMSTYLLFVGIGKFVENHSPTSAKKNVIVASRREVSGNSEFILGIAEQALRASEEYFGIPYPMDKLHIIGLTEYNGAMENWGAITSSEIFTAIEERSATVFDKLRAALVTIHEIEHQWFGDLVTMKWWDDIWLNEGFATFMSHKILDKLHPEWDLWGFFVLRYSFEARSVDALLSTHPVKGELRKASEMHEVFDSISYDKGASVLRMIEDYIGNAEFRRGIEDYIREFSYSNATSEDLWRALEKASSLPVSRIIEKWLKQAGHPLVSVKSSMGKLIFSQSRFVLSSGNTGNRKDASAGPNELWPIPIVMKINGATRKFLLEEEKKEIVIPQGELMQVIVNLGQTGFYCVEYDKTLYELIDRNFQSLSSLDKAGIINDLFQLLLAKRVEPELFYRFVSACSNEREYPIVYGLWRVLELLDGIAEDSADLNRVSLNFLKSQINRLGLQRRKDEASGDRILREFVSLQLAKQDLDFASMMGAKFEKYETLEPEIKSAVVVGYARTFGPGAFDDLVAMVARTESEVEREKLYIGLTSLEEQELIKRLLDFSASGQVPRTDIFWTLYYGSRSPRARRTVWNWTKNNFERLWELLGSTLFVMNVLDHVVPRAAVEDEEDAISFFSGERREKGEMSFKKELELLHVYAELRQRLVGKK